MERALLAAFGFAREHVSVWGSWQRGEAIPCASPRSCVRVAGLLTANAKTYDQREEAERSAAGVRHPVGGHRPWSPDEARRGGGSLRALPGDRGASQDGEESLLARDRAAHAPAVLRVRERRGRPLAVEEPQALRLSVTAKHGRPRCTGPLGRSGRAASPAARRMERRRAGRVPPDPHQRAAEDLFRRGDAFPCPCACPTASARSSTSPGSGSSRTPTPRTRHAGVHHGVKQNTVSGAGTPRQQDIDHGAGFMDRAGFPPAESLPRFAHRAPLHSPQANDL